MRGMRTKRFEQEHEKRDLIIFLVCDSSKVQAVSPTDMHFLSEASSRSLLLVCETAKALTGLCLYAGLSEHWLVAYMVSTFFSCSDSFTGYYSSR